MFRLLFLLVGLTLLAGTGGLMAYRQLVPTASAEMAPTPIDAPVASAAVPTAMVAEPPEPEPEPAKPEPPEPEPVKLEPPEPEPQPEPAPEPAAEPAPAAEPGEPPSVRYGAEGLSGSGSFSCSIEAGARRCRSD